ncbi:CPBP family intramembrane glutamic endopeptidase [Tissierella carlieri]|uniref:CPBP family intramembrane glutamic endopeptidase n=1 Tax=Tissierella carlieri TaxID=689904 RepID=UPI00386AEB25
MNSNLTKTKSEIITFLLINFAITFIMGIIMFLVYNRIDNDIKSGFAGAQMMYPALAVIAVKVYYGKDKISSGLMEFFISYIIISILYIIILLIGIFAFSSHVSGTLDIIIIIYSIMALILIGNNENNCFEEINMGSTGSFKKIILFCLLFLGLKLTRVLLVAFFYRQLLEALKIIFSAKYIFKLIIGIPMTIVLSFIPFFGEELGWRQFLQPRLQALLGRRLGVIILGFIWGIWHLPLCIMLYSPSTPIYCIIAHVLFCILSGIFIGFVYMKTGNLWSAIIIHLINNSIGFSDGASYETTIKLTELIIVFISNVIIFLPFLFTKEYKDESILENTNDKVI